MQYLSSVIASARGKLGGNSFRLTPSGKNQVVSKNTPTHVISNSTSQFRRSFGASNSAWSRLSDGDRDTWNVFSDNSDPRRVFLRCYSLALSIRETFGYSFAIPTTPAPLKDCFLSLPCYTYVAPGSPGQVTVYGDSTGHPTCFMIVAPSRPLPPTINTNRHPFRWYDAKLRVLSGLNNLRFSGLRSGDWYEFACYFGYFTSGKLWLTPQILVRAKVP